MPNHIAYAHKNFNRRDLLRWLLRGGLFIEIKIDYKAQTLNCRWGDKPVNYVGVTKN